VARSEIELSAIMFIPGLDISILSRQRQSPALAANFCRKRILKEFFDTPERDYRQTIFYLLNTYLDLFNPAVTDHPTLGIEEDAHIRPRPILCHLTMIDRKNDSGKDERQNVLEDKKKIIKTSSFDIICT
jgi:hypothetical protein